MVLTLLTQELGPDGKRSTAITATPSVAPKSGGSGTS